MTKWFRGVVVALFTAASLFTSVWISDDIQQSHLVPRSGRWPTVRWKHIQQHPVCEICGASVGLEVHHIVPFSEDPRKELDPENLWTLCRKHHFEVGHDPDGIDGKLRPNWKKSNKNVVRDSLKLRAKLNPEGAK
jgi:5-methylcytosine-specific restriction endonuclease McrA